MNVTEMSFEDFEALFRPKPNPFHADTDLVETFGKELEHVKAQPLNHVWTLVCEGSDSWLISGFAFVNRMSYIITENPWTTQIQVDYS